MNEAATLRRSLRDHACGHWSATILPVSVGQDATEPVYEQWAATYDDPGNGLFDIDEPIIDEILDGLPVGTVVDAACGTGRLTARLAARGFSVTGVDASAAMLELAKRRLPRAPTWRAAVRARDHGVREWFVKLPPAARARSCH